MLNELITWVLNTYLGKYLEDFNTAQLSIALLSGEVELEKVPIRKDALRSFGIPVQAFSGNIGKIKLQIPVRQFRTAPWCITIEHVYGVFGPTDLNTWDDEKEQQSDFEYKQSQLDAIETKWCIDNGYNADTYYSTSYSNWLSYGTSMGTKILENLELKIIDVHLRYEDRLTVRNAPFTMGIRINSLTAQSCDANWIAGAKSSPKESITYKLIELNDFSVYWDKLADSCECSMVPSRDLISQMDNICSANVGKYLINPISIKAQCKRELSKQVIRSKSKPRLSCELLVPSVKLSLTDVQYEQIVNCMVGLNNLNQIRSYRINRPTQGVVGNTTNWWRYAAKCHGFTLNTSEQKWTIAKENLKYIRIYKKSLMYPNETLAADDKDFKLHIEKSRRLWELQTLRSICYNNIYAKDVSLKASNVNRGNGLLYHWFPNWLGWHGVNADANGAANTSSQAQQNEAANENGSIPAMHDEDYKNIEEDLLNALESSIENDSFSKRDALFAYLTFTLVEGQFQICSEDTTNGSVSPCLDMEFKNLISFVEIKPRFNSYLIGVSLGSVCLKDLIARGTEFPHLVKPQSEIQPPTAPSTLNNQFKRFFMRHNSVQETDPWFQLQYEKKPTEVNSDFRLFVKSKSLDIVYNETSWMWLLSFWTKPLKILNARSNTNSIKAAARQSKFLKNWKKLLAEYSEQRKTWSFEIDISAPRIIFVENCFEKNTAVLLVDFGRFQLLKNEADPQKRMSAATEISSHIADSNASTHNDESNLDGEDSDSFRTPCSTPPGSQISHSESPTLCHDATSSTAKIVINNDTGLESALHNKIYDKYIINLTDLQVVVCKNREQIFASFKNTSSFHLLNKFNISLQLERRIIFTIDPEYPSLTLYGTLPKIVAHVNEQKINDALNILGRINFNNFTGNDEECLVQDDTPSADASEPIDAILSANILVFQFLIGQMILEVQSYEKSIAELQILGARAGIVKKSQEMNITMSVHGLLLVDAIQSFGPDFELLVASHRHVGMDSISGSLKQSEPCSPMSIESPDPMATQRPLSPFTINRAMNNLQLGKDDSDLHFDDMHALISVEINIIDTGEDEGSLLLANIAFNNLDIIATQETIVELLGFIKRTTERNVSSTKKDCSTLITQTDNENSGETNTKVTASLLPYARAEISFDFHRLNILVLRTLKKDNFLVARKVGTLTMSEAKIHASVSRQDISVIGSLGGIQIIDITPEGVNHQRIFSVGKDPLTDPPALHSYDLMSNLTSELYNNNADNMQDRDQTDALSFSVLHEIDSTVNIKVRMASVWYTHCPRFIHEISLCISQFEHYLSIFAKSIRDKATDMAMGLVQHINEVKTMAETSSDRPRNPNTGNLSVDVILNSPVIVLPRSSTSSDVLVANLGKITAYNTHEANGYSMSLNNEDMRNTGIYSFWKQDNYFIDIRNMNLYSLNTSHRKELRLSALPKAKEFYSCTNDAVAILHNTAILFKFSNHLKKTKSPDGWQSENLLKVKGTVTQALQVSLSRAQYVQLTESLLNASNVSFATSYPGSLDEKLHSTDTVDSVATNTTLDKNNVRCDFSVPIFQIDLKNEHNDSLINITFREFKIKHDRKGIDRDLQVSLRSVLMEDLKSPIDSNFRNMVNSLSDRENARFKREHCSNSCPELSSLSIGILNKSFRSIPLNLDESEPNRQFFIAQKTSNMHREGTKSQKNSNQMSTKDNDVKLVIYKSHTTESNNLGSTIKNTDSSIDFNCLNLIVSVERWFMVFDFFGLISNDEVQNVSPSNTKESDDTPNSFSELKVSVRSLNLILVRHEEELSKVNISSAFFKVINENNRQVIEGCLKSISLYDLTKFGNRYREKFSTTGPEALSFQYKTLNSDHRSEKPSLSKDAILAINMASVTYVHTKRFIVEIHLFVKELLQLQTPVMKNIKLTESKPSTKLRPFQIGLDIHADSPVILLPLAYHSSQVIVADLGEFTLRNNFHWDNDSDNIISKRQKTPSTGAKIANTVLDVMHIDLVNINLFAGERIKRSKRKNLKVTESNECLNIGKFFILKHGNNLFQETCYLKLQVERNTDSNNLHLFPDISVRGTLSKLNGIVNLQQYKLIRGFLSYNLGENIDDVYAKYSYNVCESFEKFERLSSIQKLNQDQSQSSQLDVWNTLSINLLLENVSLLLSHRSITNTVTEALACIKFIKSSLEIDSFSDGSQDIDLISKEILILDSRTVDSNKPADDSFTYILKPKHENLSKDIVQAEVHSRRKAGSSKYTILLNNMRIMAIFDCLDALKNFLQEEPLVNASPTNQRQVIAESGSGTLQLVKPKSDANEPVEVMEVILNITDSEVVFVEYFDKSDTNAIILKSTTVLSYKSHGNPSPISININHLEIFSCILGFEEESALSIIDPFTLNLELRSNCLCVSIQKQLCVRLSYNDMKMFTRMLQSIPKQTTVAKKKLSRKYEFENIAPLVAMGFNQKDCLHALELTNGKLNDAAFWLAQHKQISERNTFLDIESIALSATGISICVIDDCLDADVPLLEISFSRLSATQKLKHGNSPLQASSSSTAASCFEGHIQTIIASDYYNRLLSGWEPVIEPWDCTATWNVSKPNLKKVRLINIGINSKQLLKLNITTTLIELCELVHKNWTLDYYNAIEANMNPNNNADKFAPVKRRSPFVPFVLKNLTGEPLLFKTILSQTGGITQTEVNQQDIMCNWLSVQPDQMVQFDFGSQTKLRHMDSHKLNLHQILVQISGWTLVGPVSIDRVGLFFRYASLDMHFKKRARIVFDISLIGSAQKLITVKSALNIVNKLDKRICLKMDLIHEDKMALSTIEPNEQLSVPLRLVDSLFYFKPIMQTSTDDQLWEMVSKNRNCFMNKSILMQNKYLESTDYLFSARGISWTDCNQTTLQELLICRQPQNQRVDTTTIFHSFVCIKPDKYPHANVPGHTISLLPPLCLKNSLCCDLLYKIDGHVSGRIMPGESVNMYSINPYDSFSLSITLDNYKLSGQLKIPMSHTGVVELKLKLLDILNRELFLCVSIQSFPERGLEIYISAPVWIFNKTGLPLVYRQEGTVSPASGQFEEHEKARVVAPFIFSYSDQEGLPAMEIRLGDTFGNKNPWCKSFNIHKEVIYRELRAEYSKGCYAIGINVRRGRGTYAYTTFVTMSPRFQLYNKSSCKLEFAQKCDVTNMEDEVTEKLISALPGCNFPFHWPNCEAEPLLCVRIGDIEFCNWSNAIPMNEIHNVYINVRTELGAMHFLRLDVVLKDATYNLIFSDAHTLPPPIRIDNYSDVVINFYQSGCKPHWRTPVRAQSSLAYVLDNPMGMQSLYIEAPGGNATDFPLNKVDVSRNITYANFIYIAFRDTFQARKSDNTDAENCNAVTSQELVLAVQEKKVLLAVKCAGDRSQLWLMNSNGQLEHEGSSPPSEFGRLNENTTRMVLDIENAPNPTEYSRLVVRPPNKQRITTQSWRFEGGRLMCHASMCVQTRNGIFGLKPGCEAVLGRMESKTRIVNGQNVAMEQSVEFQKLRPGSGHLEVLCMMDGPIRNIQIHDVKNNRKEVTLIEDPSWKHTSLNNKTFINNKKLIATYESSLKVELLKGVGLSIITRTPCEELAYISFDNIDLSVLSSPTVQSIELRVADLQIDNQLLDTSCPILLHKIRQPNEERESCALILKAKILPSPNLNAVMFEYLCVDIMPCIVYLEERLILKTARFLGYGTMMEADSLVTSEQDHYNFERSSISQSWKRYYFGSLHIGSTQIRVSVFTASKLSADLGETKKSIGLKLIKFEDALIEFDKFSVKHYYDTFDLYVKAIKGHYINQIKWHAAAILGCVDFLGNPLGFANDLSEGVSGLIFEGSVKSLVKNVTHGISNSTAKLTETLSDSLGKVVLDEHDNETRQRILEIQRNTSSSHLAAGLKGFGFGLLGGVTSIVRHTYDGAQSDGFPGFLSGLGKGLVGTVTKPIIGVLDLASETATAVRESSRGSHRTVPDRKRLPRCVTGAPGGLLPCYSYRQAKGQQYLYIINRRNFTEKLMSYEPSLCNDRDAKLRLLVSTEFVRIFSRCDEDPTIMFECHFSEVLSCHPVTTNVNSFTASTSANKATMSNHYIEISTNLPKITRPRVRCQNEEIAENAARCINYAKTSFDEREQSIAMD